MTYIMRGEFLASLVIVNRIVSRIAVRLIKKTVARVAHMPEKGTSDQRFLKSASSAKVRFLSNRYVQHPFSLSPRDKREELSGGMVSSQRRGWREERR